MTRALEMVEGMLRSLVDKRRAGGSSVAQKDCEGNKSGKNRRGKWAGCTVDIDYIRSKDAYALCSPSPGRVGGWNAHPSFAILGLTGHS